MKFKRWHIVLFIAAGIAVILVVRSALSGGGKINIASRITLVDVSDGTLYWVPSNKTYIFPFQSPNSGKETVWPVYELDGSYWIYELYRGGVVSRGGDTIDQSVLVDEEAGRIETDGSSPARFPID